MNYVIDARNKRLGRLASHIAHLLQGKAHAEYDPRLSGSDRVVVQNISHVEIGGKKFSEKVYYRHTGYMGHLREKTYRQVFEKNPADVLSRAVYNMLPKNKLRTGRLKRLVIQS